MFCVGAQGFAALQTDLDAILVLRDRHAARAEPLCFARNGIEQHLDQIGAVNVVHRSAVARSRLVAERRLIQHPAGAQIAIIIGLRLDADRAHRGLQPQFPQHDRRIGGNLDAGADLGQHLGLLQHQRVDALMAQRNRSS